MKKYLAEFLGAFVLAFLVGLSLNTVIPVPTPVLAGLVLLFFVYSIGSVSGAHLNPAVTIGLWSIKKISGKEAVKYVVSQILGGLLALLVGNFVSHTGFNVSVIASSSVGGAQIFLAELCGTILFTFGIASVVFGKVDKAASGLLIGISLLLGILIAVMLGANGVLNPAVALGIQSFNLWYVLGPVCGAVLGMQLYSYLQAE